MEKNEARKAYIKDIELKASYKTNKEKSEISFNRLVNEIERQTHREITPFDKVANYKELKNKYLPPENIIISDPQPMATTGA